MKLSTTIGGAVAGAAMIFGVSQAHASEFMNLGPLTVVETYSSSGTDEGAYLHLTNTGTTHITQLSITGGYNGTPNSGTTLRGSQGLDYYLGDNELDVAGSQGTARVTFMYGGTSYTGTFTDVLGDPDNNTNPVAISPGAVPEPASWLLMLVGFGILGTALRSKIAFSKPAQHGTVVA